MDVLKIFSTQDRTALEKYCRALNILPRQFTNLTRLCDLSLLPLRHEVSHRDAGRAVSDSFAEQCYKCFARRNSMTGLIGHAFYNPVGWHFFCFNQEDIVQRGYFKKGAHFRFINWLWSHESVEDVWLNFVGDRRSEAVHMQFAR